MTSAPLPLHERYTQVDGPIEDYKRATGDWTPAIQKAYETACANADRSGALGKVAPRVQFPCPECHVLATGFQFDYVTFYESTDRLHVGPVVAEAMLIRVEDCGHTYRRGTL